MKPDDVKPSYLLTLIKKLMIKMLSLKLVMFLEYQNMKIFLQMATFQIGLKKVLLLQKKNTVPWIYVISDLKDKGIGGTFCEKKLQKTNQKELTVTEVIKKKGDKLYVKWKGYDNSFNSCIDKKKRGINE